MTFKITASAIDAGALSGALRDARAGACVTFEGKVRNENEGRPVVRLEYEAHASLAEKEGLRVLEEARGKFGILEAHAVHRTGSLGLGEVAVWVGVAAGHRAAAFEACRYIIDQTKLRVPIWKKEHYADGASGWINSAAPSGPNPATDS